MVRGPEHVFELANASYRKLVGNRNVIGKPIREARMEVARAAQILRFFAGEALPAARAS